MTAKIKPFKVGDRVKVKASVKGVGGLIGMINRKTSNPNYDWVVTFGVDSVAHCSFKNEELVRV